MRWQSHDHIVPYDAARHLIATVGSTDEEEVMLKQPDRRPQRDPQALAQTGFLAKWKIDIAETSTHQRAGGRHIRKSDTLSIRNRFEFRMRMR